MGYTTQFKGHFELDRELSAEQAEELRSFAEERHVGAEGGYPSLYCQWLPTNDSRGIRWDGGESFYGFLEPWGYELSGQVKWRGEDFDDIGVIIVWSNHVEVKRGTWT